MKVTIALLITLMANTVQAASYLGASRGATTGGAGVIRFSSLCNATYAKSRMCTVEEVGLSIHTATKSHGPAWVMPTWTPSWPSGLTGRPFDRYSVCGADDSSVWNSSSSQDLGYTVTGSGKFSGNSCDKSLPVACCR